jgi:hypothetical protein
VLLGEGPLEQVEVALLLVQVVEDACVLVLVGLQPLLEGCVLLVDLVDVGLGLEDLAVDLAEPVFVVPDGFGQLLELVVALILLGPDAVVLVDELLVLLVQGEALLLQLLDLDESGVELLLDGGLLGLEGAQFVGYVPELSPEQVDLLLELVDGLEGEFQLEPALLV